MEETQRELEQHLTDGKCFCDSFSDSYKDFNGCRPRAIWTCLQISQWWEEHYVLIDGTYYNRIPFAE